MMERKIKKAQHNLEFYENQLEHKLLDAGLIREIKAPITDFTSYQNRKAALELAKRFGLKISNSVTWPR